MIFAHISEIRLSILIPSIPSRLVQAAALYERLLELSSGMSVEILMLTDNKIMSIGEKCNHLMNASRGKYFCFLHDDDELLSLQEIYEVTGSDVDVIDFKAECRNADGSTYIVTQRLGSDVEHNTQDGRYLDCRRPPFPNCAWNGKFRKFKFADISYAEDWSFVQQCLTESITEVHIDKVLFKYNFDIDKTEASTESNEAWTNPNG